MIRHVERRVTLIRMRRSLMLAGLILMGCGSPSGGRRVPLVVTHEGMPLASAHVRAIPVDAGVVPLPVSGDTIDEYLNAVHVTGVTDDAGRVALELHAGSPYHIEVIAPPVGALGGRGPWVYQLALDGVTLERLPVIGEPGDEVRVMRGP